jgi:hypothetical protein
MKLVTALVTTGLNPPTCYPKNYWEIVETIQFSSSFLPRSPLLFNHLQFGKLFLCRKTCRKTSRPAFHARVAV